ncbi:MAG: hypothetical protein R3279_08975 [Putridiphycobacter sp.]|nr:hypothetical protein [Putridiphycobacter sp.]
MKLLLSLILLVSLWSCSINDKEVENVEPLQNECEYFSLSDFSSFIGISRETRESQLKNILGKWTGGSYTNDKGAFIYTFEAVERVPVKIYVNATSGNIETIFIEILGLYQNFEKDIERAQREYPLNICHAALLGKAPDDIIALFGPAEKDFLKVDNVASEVRVLVYYSEDRSTAITFNFYPSQAYRMSSIVVDWF